MLPMPPDLTEPEITPRAAIVLEKRYLRKSLDNKIIETPKELFWRVASTIAEADKKYGASQQEIMVLAGKFYNLMASCAFLPNSPTLMNAGTDLGQLSACFVLPVGDSIEEIFNAIKYAAMIHKSGGGTGFSFSRIRPKDSPVGSTRGVASGPLSFLRIFNTATEQIKQGGTRRGANMAILKVDHHDIMEFINAKEKDGEFNNFNLSVALTDEFMHAVENGEEISLVWDGREKNRAPARDIFNLLVSKAWQSGDPGIIFIDRINKDNPTPTQGDIESTNPCGEQPLLPYEACNLGSINLSHFFMEGRKGDWTESIHWEELGRAARLAVHFLDNVIDASVFPLEQIKEKVEQNRKIGLGVMGFADLLFLMRIPYASDKALEVADKIMSFINKEAHDESARLARKRGPFPSFADSSFRAMNVGPYRNATVTTIAPTGSLSLIAGCSSGLEPLFALCLTKTILDGAELIEFNPHFQKALEIENWNTKEVTDYVRTNGTIGKLDLLPDEFRKVFATAHEIEPIWHIKMQAAFQRHTDNGVSKTVNLPNHASRKDVEDIYWNAWKEGCKGVTVFRDGCKKQQVLTAGTPLNGPQRLPNETGVRKRPEVMQGFTHKIATGLGTMYLTINEIDGEPFEIFATIGKSGRSITAKAEAIGRLVSLALRSGIPVKAIVGQIKGIGGEHPIFRDKGLLLSIPDAIAHVLEKRYLANEDSISEIEIDGQSCPECGEKLHFQEGCALCKACGYSKCG